MGGDQGGGGVDRDRSVLIALLLTFFLGPIGVLYVSVPGGAMFIAAAIWIGIATFGIGVAALWPLAMAYASVKALREHRRFLFETSVQAPLSDLQPDQEEVGR